MSECDISGERCSFRCTGYVGTDVWDKMYSAVDSIPCEECRVHGKDDLSAWRDVVNVGLGRSPHDAKNLKRFVDEVNCTFNACVADGRC